MRYGDHGDDGGEDAGDHGDGEGEDGDEDDGGDFVRIKSTVPARKLWLTTFLLQYNVRFKADRPGLKPALHSSHVTLLLCETRIIIVFTS